MLLPIGLLLALAGPVVGGGDDEGELLFERHVLPTLRESCFECHGPSVEKPEGGLRITGRESLLVGGDGGPVLVPGDVAKSEIALAISYTDPFLEMPPDGKLPDDRIAAIERWIELGAPWPDGIELEPAGGAGEPPASPRSSDPPDVDSGREWWSFRPLERPPVPAIAPERASTPIDAFLVARLDELGIARNEPASKRELVRRVYHDLHGLPPTLAEVDAFVADESPDAWEHLVDRLLDSPRYAERWGRHWLDLVRYAQTNGYERDGEKPFAWRYRDWVIDALDRDMPYDRFLVMQLAGDELPEDLPGSGLDGLIATGFYRLGAWDDEPDDKETAVFDELDDTLRTISEGMLGVSLACARCHDHKFDPFLQEDYYSTLSYLRGVLPYEDPVYGEGSATLALIGDREAGLAAIAAERELQTTAIQAELDAIVAVARKRLVAELGVGADSTLIALAEHMRDDERNRVQELRQELVRLGSPSFRAETEWILCAREGGATPPPTNVLARGNASAKGALVEPHPPRVLTPFAGDGGPRVELPADGTTSGRRLALARWIASAENPLTARALVNRVWQMHFGRGIAPTPNDLGHAGMPPTHPELIDWLASTFVEEDGWSLKALHRRMLLTDAYRASSRATNAAALVADEANDLLWRQRPQRMTAEELCDSALLASGDLRTDLRTDLRGGRGFFPRLSREALAGASRPGLGWGVSSPEERARRSVYAFVKRGQPVPLFEAFDGPNTTLPVGTRGATTTSTQALAMLNGEFLNERAGALAARVAAEAGEDVDARVRRAYERVLAREPTANELAAARDYLVAEAAVFAESDAEIVVRPDVPPRVDQSYLDQLTGEDVLLGPRIGWTALRGKWDTPYNGTLQADELRGPALLYDGPSMTDVSVAARVTLPVGGVLGILLRAAPIRNGESGEVGGVEIRFDVESAVALVMVHGGRETRIRAELPLDIEPSIPADVVIRLQADELVLSINGREAGRAQHAPVFAGVFGLRAFGEGARLEGLTLTDLATGDVTTLGPDDPGPADARALQALCLALLNLNEFLYID